MRGIETAGRAPVTVAGLGPMGSALATAFVDAGHPTTVWNRTPAKGRPLVARGARQAPTPADAAAASPLLIVCVSDHRAARAILEDAGTALSGRTVVNLTSSTPDQARDTVAVAARYGAGYLDGAIMVPPTAVGRSDAVFFYSGPRTDFDEHVDTLRTIGGDARHLGEDPGLAVLYNTALLGLMWATVDGYLHATAMVNTAGVTSADFAPIALDWFVPAVVSPILHAATRELDGRDYPGDAGTVRMNLNAALDLLETSRSQGVGTRVPEFLREMLEKTVDAGRGDESYMSMIELIRNPDAGEAGGVARGAAVRRDRQT